MSEKISQLTPATLSALTNLREISEFNGLSYDSKSSSLQQDIDLIETQAFFAYDPYALDLTSTPNAVLTNPLPSVIEITNAAAGGGQDTFSLPVFNATDSYPPGRPFFITNNTATDVNIKNNSGTTFGTLYSKYMLICIPRAATATGNCIVLLQAYNINTVVNALIAAASIPSYAGTQLDLTLDPNAVLTNPLSCVIEITNSAAGGGQDTFSLPVFNASNSYTPFRTFLITNNTATDVNIKNNDGSSFGTVKSKYMLICTPRAATATGDCMVLVQAYNIDTVVNLLITSSTVIAAKQDKYRTVTTINLGTTVGTSNESCLLLVNSAAPITITLPQTSTTALDVGYWFDIINIGAGTVTVAREGSDTLSGNTQCDTGAKMSVIKDVAGSPNAWQTIGGTSVIPVEYSVSFYDIQNGIDGYPCTPLLAEATTFTSLTHQCDGTSVTGNFRIGATAINGGTITTNTALTTTTLTSNNVAAIGDYIKFIATAVTTPKNATFLFKGTVRRS